MSTVTYVTFMSPGSFVANEITERVTARDVSALTIPKNCFALYFWERSEVEQDGETLFGTAKNKSNTYYIGGEIFDLARLKKEHADKTMLISNMESNNWPSVICCRTKNWQPIQRGDVIVPLSNVKFAA